MIQTKLINTLNSRGKKELAENQLLKMVKNLHKITKNCHIRSIKQVVSGSTPAFKLGQENLRKGKRKVSKSTPAFIPTSRRRQTLAIKLLKANSLASEGETRFHKRLANEIVMTLAANSRTTTKIEEVFGQVSSNKRHLSKFRW